MLARQAGGCRRLIALALLALAAVPAAALAGVSLEGGAAPPAAGGVAGSEIAAACWQQGVKIVDLPGFTAAEFGRIGQEAVRLRSRASGGRTVVLIPLGQSLCAIEIEDQRGPHDRSGP